MRFSIALRRAGVTLTELLVVLVIVSILSTLAVPVYINKVENARKAVAQAECRQLAEAEEACDAHHGFYVPLQVLNDLQAGATQVANISESNTIGADANNTLYVIDPSKPVNRLDNSLLKLDLGTPDQRILKMITNWQGPFLNPQRINESYATVTANGQINNQIIQKQLDFPLDPWGRPYHFFAPDNWGEIGTGPTVTFDYDNDASWRTSTQFFDGLVIKKSWAPPFDRFAIVCFGPNGVLDRATADPAIGGTTDDIYYLFGVAYAQETQANVFPGGGNTTQTLSGLRPRRRL